MQNLNNSLVELINNQPVTTSLKIAEVFNKRHDTVLRCLNSLECSKEFVDRNFAVNEYKDIIGRTLPMYTITRDGFTFLAMGFTGKKAAQFKEAYINAFNQMELTLKQQTSLLEKQKPEEQKDISKDKTSLIDKSSFHTFSTYLFKLRYAFYNDTIYILLSDVDRFLEITRLNGRDKVRTKDNYTIHHILCDYSIVPFCVPIEGTNIFNNMCLTVPQLLELCYNLKTKRSEMLLEAFANNNFEKHIAENHKKEIEDKKLLMVTG